MSAAEAIHGLAERIAAVEVARIGFDDTIRQIVDEVKKIKDRVAIVEKTKKDDTHNNHDIMKAKGLAMVDKYDGSAAAFEDWSFHLRQLFGSIDKEYLDLFRWIQETEDVIKESSVSDYATSCVLDEDELEFMSENLWNAIVAKTKGPITHIIRTLEGESVRHRGLRAWQRIAQDARGTVQNRLNALTDAVLHPSRTTRMSDLMVAIEKWELDLQDWERMSKNKMSDPMKLSAIKLLVPSPLASSLTTLPNLETYADAKRYIQQQLHQHQHVLLSKSTANSTPKPAPKVEDVKMSEVHAMGYGDAVEEETSEHDEEGDLNIMGKGGSRFEGYCNYCGKYGHKLADCFTKTSDLKGKGKSGDQKGKGKGRMSDGKGDKGKGKGKESWGSHAWNHGNWSSPSWSSKGYGKFGGMPSGKGKGFAYHIGEDSWHGDDWSSAWEAWSGAPPTLCAVSTSDSRSQSEPAYIPVVGGGLRRASTTPSRLPARWGQIPTSNSFACWSPVVTPEEVEEEMDSQWPAMQTKPGTVRSRRMPRWNRKSTTGAPNSAKLELSILTSSAECNGRDLRYLKGDSGSDLHATLHGEWECVESVVDTGAVNSVAPMTTGKDVPLCESEGSRRGQVYHSASGDKIPNLGQKSLDVVTNEGNEFRMTFQIADVTKPLTSVGAVTDAGDGLNYVVFHRDGGWIAHPTTGKRTHFARKDGMCVLQTWLRRGDCSNAASVQPFTRQG